MEFEWEEPPEDKAEKLLGQLRIHGESDGPMYGAVKANAAIAYALLAVVERLDALLERTE